MDAGPKKRKADPEQRDVGSNKRTRGKKKWSMPRKEAAEARSIQPGDTGIWATCAMKKEAPSVADLRDLFQEYASKMYEVSQTAGAAEGGESDEDGGDIESEIQKEIEGIRKPAVDPLFTSVKLDTQCLLFFRTRSPVEPVSFVHKICQDLANGGAIKRCRFVKRLTPITATDKATEKGLEDVARKVLAPHFHGPDQVGKKFAIRTSIRNNKEFAREDVIKRVAAAVGPGHKVDLSGYDLLILVEIYKNILGMSVVGSDFEKLKRYNIAELHDAANGKAPDITKSND
ncbi:THUMP domain-containing protein [Trematosphaeria pertusa]|uniref:THUMP domain-containing protein n=1 Tax=Trematosphaeria pertusa TaxID=390896 RepID=A0A6A6HUV9_9PLEO|nr:THUMP domain-containing protein [Trematosphaeria pertusa]KAF2241975.1 THUMP domain-containing protein [Trematosphaeria pertusa]